MDLGSRGIVQAVCVVKLKELISCAVTVQLIWAFDFAYICTKKFCMNDEAHTYSLSTVWELF